MSTRILDILIKILDEKYCTIDSTPDSNVLIFKIPLNYRCTTEFRLAKQKKNPQKKKWKRDCFKIFSGIIMNISNSIFKKPM